VQRDFLPSQGFPGWSVYLVIGLEIIGGAMLILGVYSRWVAAAMLPLLLGVISVHAGNGWVFSSPNGGWEYPAFLIVGAFALLLLGDGALALSLAIKRR
jgi:putative oxidoreductase